VLNSEFMVRQAKALAAKLEGVKAASEEERINKAFLLVYGRLPKAEERQLGAEFLAQHAEKPRSADNGMTGWEQYAQVLLSANEFLYVD
jgi:hypothetical protein